jgi:DNA-binding NarL/FixJ family response regulator
VLPVSSSSLRRHSTPSARSGTATKQNASCDSSDVTSTGAAGLESLTDRELRVARLATEGKTNPQIAAELFLSQKTVETHLRNIFHKIDVSSRVALARAIDRADRTAGTPRRQ